uniref:Putative aromatic-l-amino-acid/l-histidine decarboxylase n=1 Tax=Triatoma infestans TaxID=30076 RepID=A0A023F2F5_TRIIF
MNSEDFRQLGKRTVDYIADYLDTIRDRQVLPEVKPGYLHKLLPKEMPSSPDHWTQILPDIENLIMPGVTHWHSPKFNAFYPTGSSYPSIIGEMLSAAIGCIGFNWMASPACTELEVIVLDWLAKALALPESYLNSSDGPGGGIIQGSASEATLVALLVAKEKTVEHVKKNDPERREADIKGRLVAYASDQSNSSVEKSSLHASITIRLLPSDENGSLRGSTLLEAIEKDIKEGLLPCCVIATLGSTGTCAFDCLDEIGKICNGRNIWLHVDAAYAGSACICPEYRHMLKGVQHADSFDINPHKWLLVNFDCSTMWFKDTTPLINAFSVDRVYLKHGHEKQNILAPDFRHWQIPLGRRFRSLKLWLTLRLYGLSGLQTHIRNQCSLAQYFETLVRNDPLFEIIKPATLGLVCFRAKGEDSFNMELLERLNKNRNLYMVAAHVDGKYVFRYCVCSRLTEASDVESSWSLIANTARLLLKEQEKGAKGLLIRKGQSLSNKKTSNICTTDEHVNITEFIST